MSLLRRLARLVLPTLFFLCFLLSLSASRKLEQLPDLHTLPLGAASVTGKAALAMLDLEQEEDRPVSFAVWGQQSGQTVQNTDLGRSAVLDAVALCGNSALLASSSAPLAAGDREGCLLDRSTAQSLFGSASPVGSVLEYGGRALTVRGILAVDRPLLFLQALPETDFLNRVTLQLPEGASRQKTLREFETRHALAGSWSARRGFSSWARFFSLLAPASLLLFVIFSLLKTAFSLTEYPLPFVFCLLAAGAVWFLTLWVTEFSFQFPEEYLPAKWSDFEFWGSLWEQIKSEFLLLVASEKTVFDLEALLPLLEAGAFGLLALLLTPLSLIRLKPETGKDLWFLCLLFLLLAFTGSLALGEGPLASDRLLWLGPCLILCGLFLSRRLRAWSRGLTENRPLLPAPRRAHARARRYKTS